MQYADDKDGLGRAFKRGYEAVSNPRQCRQCFISPQNKLRCACLSNMNFNLDARALGAVAVE